MYVTRIANFKYHNRKIICSCSERMKISCFRNNNSKQTTLQQHGDRSRCQRIMFPCMNIWEIVSPFKRQLALSQSNSNLVFSWCGVSRRFPLSWNTFAPVRNVNCFVGIVATEQFAFRKISPMGQNLMNKEPSKQSKNDSLEKEEGDNT